MDGAAFPGGVNVGIKRRLLGYRRADLAREAGLSEAVLQALEEGRYDPRSLHLGARAVLEKRLDLTL